MLSDESHKEPRRLIVADCGGLWMSTPADRQRMAASILSFEARRDKQGRLTVYKLPSDDGGGTYEVAGINERFHPEEARMLADLIEAGQFQEAERRACEIIATYTDGVSTWSKTPAIECYLRDCCFNRGPRGAARILQRALGVPDSGVIDAAGRTLVADREDDTLELLQDLRTAREQYERDVAKRNETSKFWKGLINRWNNALNVAKSFITSSSEEIDVTDTQIESPNVIPQARGFSATRAATNAMVMSGGGVAMEIVPVAEAPALSPGESTRPVTLRALRLGSQGPLVKAWQSFLQGQHFDPGGLDGEFGDKTQAATSAFQAANGLTSDGVAGRQTIIKAMQLGFELIEEPASDMTGSNFPPRPDFPPLENTAARQAVFGAFNFVADPRPDNRENIRILGTWERDNIVSVPIPQLRKALGAQAPASMRFHKLAAGQLKALWEDWERANLLDRILSYDGSFVPRFIRGSTTQLSNHAFGSAFDINADENPLGARPVLVGHRGSVRELVSIANRHGFYWGGHFGSRPDGMHFEIAFIQRSNEIA
ncbi:M15 family metallopeptidase [Bradyrhizobium amphicarpaeae]|nr:M15 family metallopeptidase [Bradyrhizobium amphicarpaeae]